MTFEVEASYVHETTFEFTVWDFWPFDKHYYKVYVYEDDSGEYFYYAKNLSGTTYWNQNGYSPTGTITYTQTITVGSSTSKTISGNLGLKVPVKAVEISGQVGFSSTTTKTFSVAEAGAHSRTLDRTSPTGYYSLQATHNVVNHKFSVYDKETVSQSYTYVGYGYLVDIINSVPFVSLRYSEQYHN